MEYDRRDPEAILAWNLMQDRAEALHNKDYERVAVIDKQNQDNLKAYIEKAKARGEYDDTTTSQNSLRRVLRHHNVHHLHHNSKNTMNHTDSTNTQYHDNLIEQAEATIGPMQDLEFRSDHELAITGTKGTYTYTNLQGMKEYYKALRDQYVKEYHNGL